MKYNTLLMEENINKELRKLQDELSLLDSAVKHITRVGDLTEGTVTNIRAIQEKYAEQLNKIIALYSEYLNKTYRHSEENVRKLYELFQEKVRDEERVLEKYTELSLRTEDLTHEYLKGAIDNHRSILNQIGDENKKQVDIHQQSLKIFADKITERINASLLSNEEKLHKIDELLNSYLELAQATATLKKELNSIDFEAQLNQITTKQAETNETLNKMIHLLSEIRKNQIDNNTILDSVLKNETNLLILQKVKSIQSKNSRTNFFVIILTILNALIFAMLFFSSGKELLDKLLK